VLGCVAVLALICTVVMGQARSGANLAYSLSDELLHRELAEGAMDIAAGKLAVSEADGGWLPDGSVHEIDLSGSAIEISVRRSTDFLNLNHASAETLAEGFAQLGVRPDLSARLADEILDWRDPDVTPRTYGAEAAEYAAIGRAGLPPNSSFTAVTELRALRSMRPEVFDAVSEVVTVLGTHKNAAGKLPSDGFTGSQDQSATNTVSAVQSLDGDASGVSVNRNIPYDGVTRQVGDSQPGIFIVSVRLGNTKLVKMFRGAFKFANENRKRGVQRLQFMERIDTGTILR
jgi:hypothetical protein